MKTTTISLLLALAATAIPTAALAQGGQQASQQNLTINGAAVPDAEMDAVRTRCDVLLGTNAAGAASATPGAAGAPAGGAGDGDVGGAAGAGGVNAPGAGGNAAAPAGAGGNAPAAMPATPAAPAGANASASATPPAADQAKIDVQALTAEQCRAGGFGATARTP